MNSRCLERHEKPRSSVLLIRSSAARWRIVVFISRAHALRGREKRRSFTLFSMTQGGTIGSAPILLRQTIFLVASVPGATHRRRRPGANSGTSFPPGMVPMREPGRSNVCVPPETEGTRENHHFFSLPCSAWERIASTLCVRGCGMVPPQRMERHSPKRHAATAAFRDNGRRTVHPGAPTQNIGARRRE